MKLTDYTSYADAQAHASSAALWEVFDGDREHLNIAHECITRHADGSGRPAVRIAHADGHDEILSFDTISAGRPVRSRFHCSRCSGPMRFVCAWATAIPRC